MSQLDDWKVPKRCFGWTSCRSIGLLIALTSLVLFSHCLAVSAAADDKNSNPAHSIKDFALVDLAGRRHTPAEWRERKAVVLIFLGTECPVSNGYAPAIVRLATAYEPKGVAIYGVYPDPDVNAEIATKHAAEYKLTSPALRMPLLLDPQQVLPTQTGVTRVPECVVLTNEGRVMYRGRIDDRYGLDGRRRDEPRAKDLENAIEALLAGKIPDPSETKAFGCPLPPPAKP